MSAGDSYDEDFDYNDDYEEDFDGSSEKQHASRPSTFSSAIPTGSSKPTTGEAKSGRGNQESDDDDEQKSQRLEGKIAQQQRQIDSLLCMLDDERSEHDLSKSKISSLERDLKAADSAVTVNSTGEGKHSEDEDKDKDKEVIAGLKKEVARLKDRLDDALSLSPSSSKCPLELCTEFAKFCKQKNIFVAYSEDDFENVANCIKVLKSEARKRNTTTGQQDDDGDVSGSSSISTVGAGRRSSVKSALDTGLSNASSPPANDNSQLHSRIRRLEKELSAAEVALSKHNALRSKVMSMNERIRSEKELKFKVEEELKLSNKKIDMLSNHMEKLVVHLKQEGAQKVRLAEQSRSKEKENSRLSDKCDMVSSKSAAKDRLILELREGSKVLEDQLRLMDEKYLELRTKLDYAREMGAKRVKKAQKLATELRVKFIMAGSTVPLDSVQIPDGYTLQHLQQQQQIQQQLQMQQMQFNRNGGGGGGSFNGDGGFEEDDTSFKSNSSNGSHSKIQRSHTFSPTRSNSGMEAFTKSNSDLRMGASTAATAGGSVFVPAHMAKSPNTRSTIAHPQFQQQHLLMQSPATDGGLGKSRSQVRFSRNGAAALDSRSVGSIGSVGSLHSSAASKEPDLDSVLEKIRIQAGNKQDWTPEKARSLLQKKTPGTGDKTRTV